MNIVGLGGSLAAHSSSLAALKIALNAAEAAGARTHLLDVRTLDLPLYDPAMRTAPTAARSFYEAVAEADGMLWSSPMSHGTISGSFKNALDWLQLLNDREPPYLTDKVIGLISAAGGGQGLQALNTMEFVVRALRGWTAPRVVPVAQAGTAFDPEGRPLDPALEAQLMALGHEVVRAARQLVPERLPSTAVRRADIGRRRRGEPDTVRS